MLTEFVKVASVGDLEDNQMMIVNPGSEDILLARVNGDYFAIDDWCTHAAGMLHQGYIHPKNYEVECPIHEGHFDLRTGEATMLPAEDPTQAYAVRVEGDDILVGPK